MKFPNQITFSQNEFKSKVHRLFCVFDNDISSQKLQTSKKSLLLYAFYDFGFFKTKILIHLLVPDAHLSLTLNCRSRPFRREEETACNKPCMLLHLVYCTIVP